MNKRKKVIIASKYFLFTQENKVRESATAMLAKLREANITLAIIVKESSKDQLISLIKKGLPQQDYQIIKYIIRGNDSVELISKKRLGNSISMLAVVEEDATFAFRTKIPIINPIRFLRDAPIDEKVMKYGIKFDCIEDVILAMNLLDVHYDNFFEYEENKKFGIISVLNGNTGGKPDALRDLFKINIKDKYGKTQRVLNLIFYYILSETAHNPIFNEVNYWGNFPSSSGKPNESMVFLKEMLRVTHGGSRGDDQLLIRIKKTPKKHESKTEVRLENKCGKDFETIIVNPNFKRKIKDKVVCIVDDYTTNGYSSEAAKHLLLKAGAKKVIFLAVGKYGYSYQSTQYSLEGNVFKESEIEYKLIDEQKITSRTNNTSLELRKLEELFEVKK